MSRKPLSDMTRNPNLSRSATKNALYFAAFGKASQCEERGKCSSLSARILKTKRRKLFNDLVRTDRGYEILTNRASICPEFVKTLDVEPIKEESDVEEMDNKDDDSRKTVISDRIPTPEPQYSIPCYIWSHEDDDMFSLDSDGHFSGKSSHAGETRLYLNSLKRGRPEDDSDEEEYDIGAEDEADNGEEDKEDKDIEELLDEDEKRNMEINTLIEMQISLAYRKNSAADEGEDDWFNIYEDNKSSTKAEPSDSDSEFSALDLDGDTEDDGAGDDERSYTSWSFTKRELQNIDPTLATGLENQ
jgi:hypothetical protein